MLLKTKDTSWVVAGTLVLIGLLVILSFALLQSQADTSTVVVAQSRPILNLVKLCPANDVAGTNCTALSTFVGSPNTQTQADVWAKITDGNSYNYIASLRISVHRSAIPLAQCMNASVNGNKDGNYCYNNINFGNNAGISQCVFDSSDTASAAWWKCTVTFEPWMDATDDQSKYPTENWQIQAWAQDSALNSIWKMATFENASVLSINFGSSTINYGQLPLNATSAGVAVLGTLYGNTDADMTIQANASLMTCDGQGSGFIPVENQRFGTNDVAYELLASALSTAPQDLDFESDANDNKLIARTSETTNPSDYVYFGIKIPSEGVGGNCSVTATILSVAQ